MSDKRERVPYHLRDVNNPPPHLEEDQKKNWIDAAMKAKNNYRLGQQYPPFIIPSSIYEVKFVHKNTLNDTMQMIIDYAQDSNEYTFDTESEKLDYHLALIQIQIISHRLPALVIILELAHLPPKKSSIFMQIKQFFQLVFRPGNRLYAWGSLREEVYSAMIYELFEWPIQASVFNIQLKFPDWYDWALSRSEMCCLHPQGKGIGDDIQSDSKINPLLKCMCHQPNPYRTGEKWSLQQAVICTYGKFLDKSMTINNWSRDLDPIYSTVPSIDRDKMIKYAIYDCFATTCLIRPVTQYWTFQQVMDIDIIDLFTSFKSSSLPPFPANNSSNKKIKKKNINPQKLFNIIDDSDLEPISDDDEIYLSQLTGPVTNKQPDYEEISMDEHELNDKLLVNNIELVMNEDNEFIIDENEEIKSMEDIEPKPLAQKRKSTHHRRSMESKRMRNQKRNNAFKMRRYQHYITRSMYHKFNMPFVRKILDQRDIEYTCKTG